MANKRCPIRLVFFSFGILEQGGGFENYLVSTASGLADRYDDLEVSIVTMGPEIVEKLQHLLSIYFMRVQKPKAIYRESYESIKQKLGSVVYTRAGSLRELAALLASSDIIYAKNEVLELAVLNRLGLRKLPPVILGVHTPIHYPNTPSLSARLHNLVYTGAVYRRLIRRVRSIQVNNADDLQLVQQRLKFSNVKMVRQAFDIPTLRRRPKPAGKLRLLFVGRLTEAKGIGLLVSAIETLERLEPGSFEMQIAGSGEAAYVRQVRQLTHRLPAVTYLGHVENNRVAELYDWADVTVITSNYETLNKVAVETALAGKVAVCSDIPGPREIIRHGQTGFLLPRDPQAFADCLAAIAGLKQRDPNALQQLGKAAYGHIKHTFDARGAYLDLHRDIVSLASGGADIAV